MFRTMSIEGGDGGTPATPPMDAGAASMSTRPPHPRITPDAFLGDSNWDDWIEHFEGSAQWVGRHH